jgi:hypothetical protein
MFNSRCDKAELTADMRVCVGVKSASGRMWKLGGPTSFLLTSVLLVRLM